MVNWIPIVAAALAAIPAAALFFVAYGRYDGSFQDRVVFLFFIGGLILGGFLGFLALLILNLVTPLVQVVGLALLLPIGIIAAINRRKWQGERHAIFNGGAAGLGVAVMLGFSFLYFRMQRPYAAAQARAQEAWEAANLTGTAPPLDTVAYAFQGSILLQGTLLAIGLAGIFFGVGLIAGDGVRRKKQFQTAFLGTATLLAPVIFLEEYFRGGLTFWTALLAAYGAIFAFAAERKLLIEGVEDDARRKRRRARRKAAGP